MLIDSHNYGYNNEADEPLYTVNNQSSLKSSRDEFKISRIDELQTTNEFMDVSYNNQTTT